MSPTLRQVNPIKVFYSYSHKDEPLREELNSHLAQLKHDNVIESWDDRNINAGKEWEREIDRHLNLADLILLLVSADFLVSDYCYSIEMRRAMERHEVGSARVIPVILRPCAWSGTPLSKLQVLPRDGKPVTLWPNRDQAFLSITEGIRLVVDEMSSSHKPSRGINPEMVVNALSRLLPSIFDMIVFRLNVPTDIISSSTAPQRTRALEVVRWVDMQDHEIMDRLVAEIEREAPRLLSSTR